MLRLVLRWFAAGCLALTAGVAPGATADRRPNILWLSCEDLSPNHLGCYGGRGAITPAIDGLARRGVRFTHAFANAGVCAPSRTGIITGMAPTSLGANGMRSRAAVPDFLRGFPAYLRQAGYYCTNNAKTDYNLADFQAGWDESSRQAHWRNRPDRSRPFFAVFNHEITHESRVFAPRDQHEAQVKELRPEERQVPEALDVPPIYPDDAAICRDQADLHELATVMDRRVGERLKELEEDGLLEDTIVFFWSDHGDGLPRCKRWLYDSGTRIPLVVSIPERFRVDGQGVPGSTDDRLVSGLDFGPTLLNLAGVQAPPHMQGRPFLGGRLPAPREYVHAARDRMDAQYDMIRSVRDPRYLYIRNLMPWKPYSQAVAYGEQQDSMKDLRRLAAEGKLPPQCDWFAAPAKPEEELYDCDADPWQQHNRIDDPALAEVRDRLRREQEDWTFRTRDAHLLPEPMLVRAAAEAGSQWAVFQGDAGLERLRAIRRAALGATATDLSDPDEAVRYWVVQRLGWGGNLDAVEPLLRDPSPDVRIAAAAWLGRGGRADRALPVLVEALADPSPWIVVAALTALDEMGDAARPALGAFGSIRDAKHDHTARLMQKIRRRLDRRP